MSRRTWIIMGVAVGLLAIYFLWIKPKMPSDRDQVERQKYDQDVARYPRR